MFDLDMDMGNLFDFNDFSLAGFLSGVIGFEEPIVDSDDDSVSPLDEGNQFELTDPIVDDEGLDIEEGLMQDEESLAFDDTSIYEDIEADFFDNDNIESVGREAYYDEYGNYYPETFNPTMDSEGIIGDPGAEIDNWEYQGYTNGCAPYAQKFVLEKITGREYEADDIIELATENGWYDPSSGTTLDDIGNIIEHEGIVVDRMDGVGIETIEQALREGEGVIVAIDGEEIWDAEPSFVTKIEDSLHIPSIDAGGHAVEVIGIDRSDAMNPMVILNDSGHPGGQGLMVPLDQFEGAWNDFGNTVIITDVY